MPRGVKGSGKSSLSEKETMAKRASTSHKTVSMEILSKKPRKPYPSREERITLADARIERLAKLNDKRRTQIEKSEATLNARKAALGKGIAELESAIAKKERLVNFIEKPAKEAKPKLSPEELKALRVENVARARAAKKKTVKEPKPKLSTEDIRTKRVENAAKARAAKKKAMKALAEESMSDGQTTKTRKPKTKTIAVKKRPAKTLKPKMTPEELKAFRIELMAKARAAKKAKAGK